MRNKKVLITGGAGYIGSQLAQEFLKKGHEVIIVDNFAYSSRDNVPAGAKIYNTNILDKELENIFIQEKPDIIYHLAASKDVNASMENPVEFASVNILGSLNVIASAKKAEIERIIFTSTAGVYGNAKEGVLQKEADKPNPSSPYAWTKLAIEDYLLFMNKQYGMKNIIVRFANVYGFGKALQKSVINIFIEKMLNNESITLHGDGEQTRDFIYLADLIACCVSLLDKELSDYSDAIFNLSTGKEITINDVIKKVRKFLNKEPNIIRAAHVFSGQKRSLLDTAKTAQTLNWRAKTSLDEGIVQMILRYKYTI